ncbi:MAG: hypothetical protein ACTSYC_06785 [Promethearchaeota archaeon]
MRRIWRDKIIDEIKSSIIESDVFMFGTIPFEENNLETANHLIQI